MKQTCSRTWTSECSSAASYSAGTCQTHIIPTYSDDREDRVAEHAGGLLEALQAARDRAQDDLRQAADQADRRDVEQQHVLDHVHRERLVGEAVDRRDQRDEQREEAAEVRHEAPGRRLAAPAQAALRAQRGASA